MQSRLEAYGAATAVRVSEVLLVNKHLHELGAERLLWGRAGLLRGCGSEREAQQLANVWDRLSNWQR